MRTDEENSLNGYPVNGEVTNQQIVQSPRPTAGTQQEVQNNSQVENDPREVQNQNELIDVINSFIRHYFDWNYVSGGRTLSDYVTEDFFGYVREELGAEYGDLHEHGAEGSEVFFNQTADIFVEDLVIFEAIGNGRARFDVIVEFNVYYDIPPIEPFRRHNVLRLEIINDGNGYLINRMTNVKDIW